MKRLLKSIAIGACAGLCTFALAARAQTATPGAGILRAVLASTPLPNVADAPRHYRLLRVSLAERQASNYAGATGFVYVLSGTLDVASGSERQTLAKGDALLLAAGKNSTLRVNGSEPAVLLHFLFGTAEELSKSVHSAAASELYRTSAPIQALKSGPYEFTLVRVTFPPGQPFNPQHHRSGAALYYVQSGTGILAFDGKTEPRPSGAVQYEPHDFVHRWGNPHDTALVIIQANISQEGVPAVIFVPQAGAK